MSNEAFMRGSWRLAVAAFVLALGAGSAGAQVTGTADLVGNVLLKVNGCGKDTDVVTAKIEVASNGTWSARDGFSFSGTDTLVGSSGRKLAFQFDSGGDDDNGHDGLLIQLVKIAPRAAVPVMSPLAPATRIAFRLFPRNPLIKYTNVSSATGDGIGFIVRPAVCQINSPVSRS